MAELQRQGKVRWIGLSNVSVDQIRHAETIAPIATVQNRLNPFFRESLTGGVVRYCEERGIGFLAYSPTGGGRLQSQASGASGRRAHRPAFGRLTPRGGAGVGPRRVAAVLAIPSARTVGHALDSISAADLTLSPEDRAAIDRAEFSRA